MSMENDFSEKFRNKISSVITKEGMAYDLKAQRWGDSRGQELYSSWTHMQSCSVTQMTNYDEHYSWNLYDTFQSNSYMGIKANLTCSCGEVQNVAFILQNATMSTILGWLLEE